MTKARRPARKSGVDRLEALRQKLAEMDLGSGNFWKPSQGRSTIRILPETGSMSWFFVEVGQHYIDGSAHYCPDVCTDGKEACPICEVNQALWDAGEKDAASKLRVRRSFWMNVIVRGHENEGVKIYTPGVTVFSVVVALIGDADYGDITDLEDGFDIRVVRDGEGLGTTYQVLPGGRPCPVSDDMDEIEQWVVDCTDLQEFVFKQLKSYDDLVVAAGMEAYIDGYDEKASNKDEAIDDDDEDVAASAQIQNRLARRRAPASRRKR